IANTTSTASRARVSMGGANLPAVVGTQYTVLAKIRLASPQSGTTNTHARKIEIYESSTAVFHRSVAAPNEAGVHEVRLTFTATSAGFDVRLWNGVGIGGGDVWWDDLMIVEGEYDGPFVQPFTPGDQWWVLDESGAFSGVKMWNGATWADY